MISTGPRSVRLVALAFAAVVTASDAAAQQSNFALSPASPGSGGWILIPTLALSGGWDDNVTLAGRGDATVRDYVTTVNPQMRATFNGRRGQIDAMYDGAFLIYRGLNSLDSYDQRGSFSARRLLTKHVALFARDSFSSMPTTEAVQLAGVPFVRAGSKQTDLSTGVEAALGPQTSLVAAYNFDWVRFDSQPAFVSVLFGGHSHGGSIALRHQWTATTVVTANYDLLRGTLIGPTQIFDIQDATLGLDQRLSRHVHASGGAGVSRLSISPLGETRTGPAYRAGLAGEFRRASVDVNYSRSFVPSFTFGGTMQNEELIFHTHVPLSRRAYAQSSVAWRKNDPLEVGALSLRSWWIEGSVGYLLQPWAHIEGFYGGTHQTVDVPGGIVNRNRVGVQIVTTKPMRIR
jgi:hypothetical protein